MRNAVDLDLALNEYGTADRQESLVANLIR